MSAQQNEATPGTIPAHCQVEMTSLSVQVIEIVSIEMLTTRVTGRLRVVGGPCKLTNQQLLEGKQPKTFGVS